MNASLQRKEFVGSLVDVCSLAISHDRLDDAESVLACLRVLRPRLAQLDTYDAWIAMKRRRFPDAIRILRNLDATVPNWALGKALMALCQFATGDVAWRGSAYDVLENGGSAEASALVRVLVDPHGADAEAERDAHPQPSTVSAEPVPQGAYLRA